MRAKKSLGQNFLKDEVVLTQIINTSQINLGDEVLEIGPGEGALTERLLIAGAKVLAIEKDKRLIPYLTQKFKSYIENSNLTLLEGDILKLDLEELTKNYFLQKTYKLVANIPYYITGVLLQKFLTSTNKPSKMVILLQKEVAERIIVMDKKESILSLSVKLYGEPKIIAIVNRQSFSPVPGVDSAILEIKLNSISINKELADKYFQILHVAFAHKRKKMLSNLESTFESVSWINVFEDLGLDTNIRAEKLTKDDFLELAKNVDNL